MLEHEPPVVQHEPPVVQHEPPVVQQFYPEYRFGGFTHVDTTVEFYTRIAAILESTDRVLDFGAGRGANIMRDNSSYRRQLQTLQGRCRHLEGCDIDPIVLENPFLDSATVIEPLEALPYGDSSFDLVVADWVFEHVQEPEQVVAELLRVVRPGGYICARTPNKWGYIAIASRIVGNSQHTRLLSRVQPRRLERDVFPTAYRMNTISRLRQLFAGSSIAIYLPPSDPSYYFGRKGVYRGFKALHSVLPSRFQTALLVFVEKGK